MTDTNTKPREIVNHSPFRKDVPGAAPKTFKSDFERQVFESVRERADRPIQASGSVVTVPQQGDTPASYRATLVSEVVERTNLAGAGSLLAQASDMGALENVVFSAAMATPEAQGRLAPIVTVDRAGREITEWVGDKKQWLKPFVATPQIGAFCDERGRFQRTPVLL